MTPKQEDQMSTAQRRASTSRRGFLHDGAMLAGAMVAPTGCAGVAEAAAPRSPVRFAQAGAGTAVPPSGVMIYDCYLTLHPNLANAPKRFLFELLQRSSPSG